MPRSPSTSLPVLALTLWALLTLMACQTPDPATRPDASASPDTTEAARLAQTIIDATIDTHGGDGYTDTQIDFVFRDHAFQIEHRGAQYAYTRTRTDPSGEIVRDVLSNDGLTRTVGGQAVSLDAGQTERIMTAVNSVPYFVLLPYRLNDPAVQKTYTGTAMIDGESYHQIEVTFREEGGGEDFDDVYMYWIHPERETMDYLAYTFHESDEGHGSRFRKAVNVRTVGGLRFADYINYAADWSHIDGDLTRYPALFNAGTLDTFSVIQTEQIAVTPLETAL
ncbi:MAG: DUF6503 family protein [Bacteroidota bacterium]